MERIGERDSASVYHATQHEQSAYRRADVRASDAIDVFQLVCAPEIEESCFEGRANRAVAVGIAPALFLSRWPVGNGRTGTDRERIRALSGDLDAAVQESRRLRSELDARQTDREMALLRDALRPRRRFQAPH